MSILRLLPGPHISEFAPASDGRHFNGTCTQASAAMAYAAAYHPGWTQQQCIDFMVAMRDAQFARGDNPDTGCAANGASTVKSMAYELRQRGANVLTEWDFAGNQMPHDWHTLIHDHAGINPILLQVSNAQGLFDTAGTHEDAGVHDHAIYVAGIAQEGYVVYDPNNPTVMHTGDIYNLAALTAASPCGLIMLAAPVTPGVPDGWQDDSTTLTAPNGVTIIGALRGFVLAHNWHPDNLPLAPEYATQDVGGDGTHGNGTEQLFQGNGGYGGLGYTDKEGAFPLWTGTMITLLRQQVTQATQAALDKTTIQGVLADLQDASNKLEALAK